MRAAIACMIVFALGFSGCGNREDRVKIILDTDVGNDCDDMGALALLHQLANRGEAEILATMYPMNDDAGAATIDAVNTWYGRGDIPVGTYKGSYQYKGKHNDFYNSAIAQRFENDLGSGKNAPDAVQLYRKILSSQPDGSVTIVVVGPQRLIADLISSPPDSISGLDGKTLVERKVAKLVSMGTEHPNGHEWNIRICPEAARQVATDWPTPVFYSGFEIGKAIMTGERLMRETGNDNPIRIAYETNPMVDSVKNRHSWDQTAVLFAVRGLKDYWTARTGMVHIDDDGKNKWVKTHPKHHYLVAEKPAAEMKKIIEDFMVMPPEK